MSEKSEWEAVLHPGLNHLQRSLWRGASAQDVSHVARRTKPEPSTAPHPSKAGHGGATTGGKVENTTVGLWTRDKCNSPAPKRMTQHALIERPAMLRSWGLALLPAPFIFPHPVLLPSFPRLQRSRMPQLLPSPLIPIRTPHHLSSTLSPQSWRDYLWDSHS